MQHCRKRWFSYVRHLIFILGLCLSTGMLYGHTVKHCSTSPRSFVRLQLVQAQKAPAVKKVERYYSLISQATDDRERRAVVQAVRRMLNAQRGAGVLAGSHSPLKELLTKTLNKMIYNPRYERWNKQTHQMLVDLYSPAKKYEKRVERGKSRDVVKHV